jgi:putative ABC transport system permease protein
MSLNIRHALRALARRPGYTATAVVTIALAIGLNSSVFSFIDGVLTPLPYGEPDRLVDIYTATSPYAATRSLSSLREVDAYREARALAGVAAAEEATVLVGEALDRVEMAYTTANLFDVLAVRPARGRTFVEADGDDAVVVISDILWRDLFDRDPAALGATLRVAGRERTVVGIMPPGIGYPMYARLWLPFDRIRYGGDRSVRHVQVIGRLAAGAAVHDASRELAVVAEHLAELHPQTNEGTRVILASTAESLRNEMRPVAAMLFGAGVFVLLIACANVANLMLARGEARRREIAIRCTLGAQRRQVAGQLLLESAIIGSAGGALGLLLALWGRDVIVAMLPVEVPAWMEFGLDARVIVFTLLVSGLAVLLAGLAPALLSTKVALAQRARTGDDDTGRARTRRGLVVAQTALAFMLLVGAGLLFRSALNVQRADLGYDPAGVLTSMLRIEDAAEAHRAAEQASEIVARLERLAGVGSVTFTAALPAERLAGAEASAFGGRVLSDAAPPDGTLPYVSWSAITPDFFRTLGLPIVAGRGITAVDGPGAPAVVVLSESAARRLWPGEHDVIGRRLSLGGLDAPVQWYTVVGVAGDRRVAGWGRGGPAAQARAELYVSAAAGIGESLTLVFRAAPGVGSGIAAGSASRELAALAPAIDAQRVQPLESVIRQHGPLSWMARILGGFAAVAIALAMLGLYGVLAWNVARRTREIGVRMALGAHAGKVKGMIVFNGIRLAAIGTVLGGLGGAALAHLLSSMLFGVQPLDPLTYAGVAALLFATAAVAAWIPARAASRVDPFVALRSEA